MESTTRFNTYQEIYGIQLFTTTTDLLQLQPNDDTDDDTDDDDNNDDLDDIHDILIKPTLRQFLNQSLLTSALHFAALAQISPLLTLCLRHSDSLWPHRFILLDTIPDWVDPTLYLPILPALDHERIREKEWTSTPWSNDLEPVELEYTPVDEDKAERNVHGEQLLEADQVTQYYLRRTHQMASDGLIPIALTMVQHGVALGVSGLGELGEELSLLSKLVYDRPSPSSTGDEEEEEDVEEDWTLERWRSLSTMDIIKAYLIYSTPATICLDLRRLVLPYLSVLESHLERAGTPDPTLSTRYLYQYILYLASPPHQLSLLVSIFDASKPTLPKGKRIIRDDKALARLSIACLYGGDATTQLAFDQMGKIFECLPALDESSPSLSTSSPQSLLELARRGLPLEPTSIFDALESFTPIDLSSTLDGLDLHLGAAETFSRYFVPVPLKWFILTHDDAVAQKVQANLMVRSLVNGNEDEWSGLMAEFLGLGEGHDEDVLRKAFWRLDRPELLRVFFLGLLESGNFKLAKLFLRPTTSDPPVDEATAESIVIEASRGFYDRAKSGNMHKGDMKLAFDVLSIVAPTPTIRAELDFIEATSRLTSFNLISTSTNLPLSPIEIRLATDRLCFVERLLASNEDAYRHPDVILDLVNKLGYRDQVIKELRTFGMIVESGLSAEDYERSANLCERMVETVERWPKRKRQETEFDEAKEMVWQGCFQLGKHPEYTDLARRLALLGRALLLCPASQLTILLSAWSSVESALLDRQRTKSSQRTISEMASGGINPLLATVEYTTNQTKKTIGMAASYLPFVGAQTESTRHEEVQKEKARSTAAGFADWLIGADQ